MLADRAIIDAAIAWHVRLAEADEAGWAAFVAWLEASPAHAAAYDSAALHDRITGKAQFPGAAPTLAADNDNPPRRRWPWLAGTAAAAAVAVMLAPSLLTSRASSYDIATQPGQRRVVALADGTSIELSGGTRLRLDRDNPRVASLLQGEATFHVRHDAAHPFAMTSGAVTIQDLGTVFNVVRDGGRLSVAVSEGAVMFRPDRDALTLSAGDALSFREASGEVARSKVSPDAVGGWRTGMVSFDGESLGDVAATLHRLYAIDVTLEGSLSGRPFTGMVRFTGAADRDVPHLAALIGANWRRDGDRWILSGGTSGSR